MPGGDGNRLYRNLGDGPIRGRGGESGCERSEGRGDRRPRVRLRQRRRSGPLRDVPVRPQSPVPQPGQRHVRGDRRLRRRRAERLLHVRGRARLRPGRRPRPLRSRVRAAGPRPERSGEQRPAEPPVSQRRRRPIHRRLESVGNRRHPVGPRSPGGRPGRRRLARPLRRQRLRREHVLPQQPGRHVHGRRGAGRGEGRRLRHGRHGGRLRRRRPARLLRLELLVPAELVPPRLPLPHARVSVLPLPAPRVAPPEGDVPGLVALPADHRRPLRADVRRSGRVGHVVVVGLACSSTATSTAEPTSSS